MCLLHTQGGVAHLVHGFALAGTLGGVRQQRYAGVNAEHLGGVGGFNGGLDDLVLGGVNVDGAVAHGDALITAHQDKAGADGLDAGLALDELQRRAHGVGGGVGCAAQQAVCLAHLDQHGAEVVALGQGGAALLIGHLALAQLHHLGDHLVKAFIAGGVQDLCAVNGKAALGSRLLDLIHVAQQDDLQGLACHQTAGSGQNAGIGTLGKYDRFGFCLQLLFKILENGHTSYLHIFRAATLRLTYRTIIAPILPNAKIIEHF